MSVENTAKNRGGAEETRPACPPRKGEVYGKVLTRRQGGRWRDFSKEK